MNFWNRLLGRIPVELPCDLEGINSLISKTILTYGLENIPAYHRTVATMIHSLPPHTRKVSPHQLFLAIKRAEATYTAYVKLQALKKEELEAEKAKQAATPSAESMPAANQSPDPGVGQAP